MKRISKKDRIVQEVPHEDDEDVEVERDPRIPLDTEEDFGQDIHTGSDDDDLWYDN